MPASDISEIDLEQGTTTQNRRGSSAGIDVSTDDGESLCSSHFRSANGGSCEEGSFPMVEIGLESEASISNSGERNCRICHMGLESSRHECGLPTQLGCSCKDDLCFVHKHCAETWFNIKGNKRCEICLSIARNFAEENEDGPPAEQQHQGNGVLTAGDNSEAPRFWRGNRLLNLFLTFVVSAFVISWFFQFNRISQQ